MSSDRSPTPSQRDAAIYRKAAERVASGLNWYSCTAIQRVSDREEAVEGYQEMFGPSQVWNEPYDNQQGIRILMLCFMAAITERP